MTLAVPLVSAQAPEGTAVQQQIQIMENLISMKVDGIALCATDPTALAPYLNKAVEALREVPMFRNVDPKQLRESSGPWRGRRHRS